MASLSGSGRSFGRSWFRRTVISSVYWGASFLASEPLAQSEASASRSVSVTAAVVDVPHTSRFRLLGGESDADGHLDRLAARRTLAIRDPALGVRAAQVAGDGVVTPPAGDADAAVAMLPVRSQVRVTTARDKTLTTSPRSFRIGPPLSPP